MSHTASPIGSAGSATTAELAPARLLTAGDRCDSCGAQAYVRVTIVTGELLFCAHHGNKFKEKLATIASDWHDESDRLLHSNRV